MIPQHTIQLIKERANDDILAIVEDYVKLKRSGSSYKGKCPFHDENTPSFSVSEARRIFKCFGCDEGGDAVSFYMKMEGLSFIEAIRELADRFGIIIEEEHRNRTSNNYTPPNAILPGIRDAKRHIRKAETANLCFSGNITDQLRNEGQKNTVQIKQFDPDQARILAKYTDQVIIYCQGLKAGPLFSAIKTAYKQNLSVKLAISPAENPVHWSKFITENFPRENKIRRACISILAAIPDSLSRSIEINSFSTFWDNK